jgi:putative membrane protein
MARLRGALIGLTVTGLAFAHLDQRVGHRMMWTAWNGDWWLWILITLAGWLYARGVRRLWQVAGRGEGVTVANVGSFAAGWLILVLALLSPLDALGGMLFSAHMVQHELLMIVAAPLLILGRPLGPYAWALPERWRHPAAMLIRELGIPVGVHFLTRPLPAWTLGLTVLWIWHVPALFDAALASEGVHTLQHLSFFLSSLLFWWSLVRVRRGERSYGVAVFSTLTTGLHTSLLGALLTFAASPWYAGYIDRPAPWGLTPLEDQQLGGLIMWIPGGLIYLVAVLALMALWLQSNDPLRRIGPAPRQADH